MQTDTQMLGEVTVKGQMPTHKMWVILSKTADSTTVQLTMVTSSDLVHSSMHSTHNKSLSKNTLFKRPVECKICKKWDKPHTHPINDGRH